MLEVPGMVVHHWSGAHPVVVVHLRGSMRRLAGSRSLSCYDVKECCCLHSVTSNCVSFPEQTLGHISTSGTHPSATWVHVLFAAHAFALGAEK